MHTRIVGLVIFLCSMVCSLNMSAQENEGDLSLTIERFKENTIYLSSDELGGRGAGSEGIKLAASHIANEFSKIGLETLPDGTYVQLFDYPEQEEQESNIIGFIPAQEPTTKSLIFTAHYDGYGIIKNVDQSDSIYNGARDNAIGVAALMELARIYVDQKAPKVNLVFMATAGEEFGLVGSSYYLEHPVFNADDIVMCLNIDGFNVSGKRANFFVMPRQGVDFVDDMVLVAQRCGWIYDPPEWVDSMNKNFDTASFLSRNIPAMTLWIGDRLLNGEMAPKLNFGNIHSPEDEINGAWDWSGVQDHLELYKNAADYFINLNSSVHVNDPGLFQ
ncbi:M28 family peptidase [Lutimonas sp.]|uniref:M28 family peptidase n=1 Tax=Lutimonas sp. TaxID=1872403 RepID=UPI003D9B1431